VAIANRNGGITKIYANHEDCAESNGMAGLQTSSGGADLLAWDVEECRAWHTPMAYNTQRPVAWSPGTFNPGACAWEGQMVWTAAAQSGASGSVVVTVLDGETGVVDSEVPIPEIAIGYFGPYGAAFDTNGDFWFVDSGNDGPIQELVRVDSVTLDYDIWMTPSINPYGFTVDTLGRPWIAGYAGGIARFDPVTETFDVNNAITGLGIQEDADGIMWMAHYPWSYEGVIAIDRDTMAVIDQIDLPSNLAKGVSIDFYGYVWVVDQGTSAFRIDPATQTFDTFTGLVGPYTYSDMTGWGLSSVSNPEG
jgi:streptogramin lyase